MVPTSNPESVGMPDCIVPRDRSSAWRVTWIPANSDVSATNESDQTKNLMILKFKDGPAEQALVRSEAPRPEASQ